MGSSPGFNLRSLPRSLGRAWRKLGHALGLDTANERAVMPRRFARLQRLEDRSLPSATPLGAEFRINTSTSGDQRTFAQTSQAVAVAPSGDFVVTWSSQGQDGDGWGIY